MVTMKRVMLWFLIFLLTSCTLHEPLKGLSDLPRPEEITFYDGAEETVVDRVMLNFNQVWGRRLPRTDIAYYYLPPDSSLQHHEQLTEIYSKQLEPLGWTLDNENSFTDVHIVFTRQSRIGNQTLVITRVPFLANNNTDVYSDDALLLISLYPVSG
jgi:hypothetical protein